MVDDVHYQSSKSDHETPQPFFDKLDSEFHFTLDPAATPQTAKCDRFYTPEDDGLNQSWANERVFLNPPYSRKAGEPADWLEKAHHEARQQGAWVVCLVASRTSTRWWHQYCMKANEIRFVKGRLTFSNSDNAAPFPSAVIVFREYEEYHAPRISTYNQP